MCNFAYHKNIFQLHQNLSDNSLMAQGVILVHNQMKHKGSTFEYKEARDADLLRAYREQIMLCDTIDLTEIFKKVVLMPSARFWVSEERAAIVIARMFRGDKLETMKTNTREMYEEIFKRVKDMKEKLPDMSLFDILFHVVRQPAPKFYLTPDSAKVITMRIKREQYKKVQKRLRHMFND